MQNSKNSAALRARKNLRATKPPASHIRPFLCVKSHSLHADRFRKLVIRRCRNRQMSLQNSPDVTPEFSYPEGVERLIGQGWREAPTLSNRRIECIRTL